MNVEACGKYAMSYGVPTAATITGFPLFSSALTSLICPGAPQALKVEITTRLVRLRQSQRVLRHVVEDHLGAHRGRAQEPRAPPQLGDAVLEREAVAAMSL